MDESEGIDLVAAVTFPTVGAVIASRRPGNWVGWIFCAIGILQGATVFGGEYGIYALITEPGLPAGVISTWFGTWAWLPSLVLMGTLLLLLFPDGRLPSRRWRPLAWAIGMFIAVSLVIVALSPGPFVDFPSASNPFGVEAAMPPRSVLVAGELVGLVCVVAAILSLILRFYRSRGEKRLQLKWFTYAAAVGVSTPLLLSVLAPAAFEVLGRLVWTLGFLSLPVSAAVAILKYRLYDIDRIINRTLVYGLLTVSLALVYVSSVFSLQYVLRALAGETSQLIIVASTLAIAALFNPLRRRIQDVVDRRFYRKKYDAQKTLAAFSARLRDETDLETLGDDLVAVAREAVQPAHVSLWLRERSEKPGHHGEPETGR